MGDNCDEEINECLVQNSTLTILDFFYLDYEPDLFKNVITSSFGKN